VVASNIGHSDTLEFDRFYIIKYALVKNRAYYSSKPIYGCAKIMVIPK